MVWPSLKLACSLSLPSSLPPSPIHLSIPFPKEPPGVSLQPLHSLLYPSCLASIHLSTVSFTAYSCPSLLLSPILHPPIPCSDSCHCEPCSRSVLGCCVRMGSLLLCCSIWVCVYACAHVCMIVGVWVLCPSASMSCCSTSAGLHTDCTSTELI